MKTKTYNDIGQTIGIKGDFDFNPQAVDDGYGVETPVTLSDVHQAVAEKPDYYTNIPSLKTSTIQDKVAPVSDKPVSTIKTKPPVPFWVQWAYRGGVPAGMTIGLVRGSGIMGIIGWGIVGGITGVLIKAHYENTSMKEELSKIINTHLSAEGAK